jgi:hypothetical protein
MVQPVSDIGSNADENIAHAAKVIGRSTHRRRVFDAIYTGKRRVKSVHDLMRLSGQRAQVQHLTVDEIYSFRRVRSIGNSGPEIGNELSEAEFKSGLQRILGEDGRFKDWGGEIADLFTTQFRVERRRRPVALALKGPATKGKLTPGKMGKNGDQIQRLFEAPAEVFLVQYCRQVDSAVPTQMKQLAIVKSLMTNSRVFYGVIDGKDSRRLMCAYPDAFRRVRRRKKRRA